MNRRDFLWRGALAAGAAAVLGRRMHGADGGGGAPAEPAGRFVTLRGGVGLFIGRGGTIGTFVSKDAALIIDTQFPGSVEACLDGVKAGAGREVDVVINTHHHGDHTSGNVSVRARGIRRIVAHEKVPGLQRDWAARRDPPATVEVANETFSQRWQLDLGNEVVRAEHFGPAHTGGDIITHFEKANVAHMGDLVFNRLHPVIDRPAGASIAGWIGLLEEAADHYPADTVYIFGHGRDDAVHGERADLLVMRDYLSKLLGTVQVDIQAGRTLEQVKERKSLEGFEAYGGEPRLPRDLETAFQELTAAGG